MLKKKIYFIIILIVAFSFFNIYAVSNKSSSWAEVDIKKAIQYNLITENEISNFQYSITREKFCEIIINLYESLTKDFDLNPAHNPFIDTTNPKLIKAYNLGITNGLNAKEFGPYRYISREEAVTILSRAIKASKQKTYLYNENENNLIKFWDQDDISAWAIEDINEMEEQGYVNGTASGYFYPKYNISTEECLTMAVRVFESLSLEYKIIKTGIIHGAGEVEGFYKTNSLEAIQKSISEGGRIIEIDFNFTRDDELVCIHDWRTYYSQDIIPLSLDEFNNRRILNKFTPMDIELLVNVLKYNPGVYIVTDIKDDNIKALNLIASRYPEIINRIIPQAYNRLEVSIIRDLGYKNIILTFYKMPYDEVIRTSNFIDFAKENSLLALTFSYELASENYISRLKESNVLLLIHTISTKEEQSMYRSLGVDGFYTDYVIFDHDDIF